MAVIVKRHDALMVDCEKNVDAVDKTSSGSYSEA